MTSQTRVANGNPIGGGREGGEGEKKKNRGKIFRFFPLLLKWVHFSLLLIPPPPRKEEEKLFSTGVKIVEERGGGGEGEKEVEGGEDE